MPNRIVIKYMRYVIRLKLATDRFICDSACFSCLQFCIYLFSGQCRRF